MRPAHSACSLCDLSIPQNQSALTDHAISLMDKEDLSRRGVKISNATSFLKEKKKHFLWSCVARLKRTLQTTQKRLRTKTLMYFMIKDNLSLTKNVLYVENKLCDVKKNNCKSAMWDNMRCLACIHWPTEFCLLYIIKGFSSKRSLYPANLSESWNLFVFLQLLRSMRLSFILGMIIPLRVKNHTFYVSHNVFSSTCLHHVLIQLSFFYLIFIVYLCHLLHEKKSHWHMFARGVFFV